MPKLIAERIIAPALMSEQPIRVRCHEASIEQLLSELAVHKLDLVLSDQPVPDGLSIKAYNHRLGESGMSFFTRRSHARRYRGKFPECLQGAPMLLPSPNSALRRRLDDWFEELELFPSIVGEFDDSALLKAFGEAGTGIFAGPTVIEDEICRMYRMSVIGETDEIINTKAKSAIANGLTPIICVGETLDQREAGETHAVNETQVRGCLAGLEAGQVADAIIAYEPVWAIGTGHTATPAQAQEVPRELDHDVVRIQPGLIGIFGQALLAGGA